MSLGYSRDGVHVRVEPRYIDINSDDFGGAAGGPTDVQIVGAVAHITAEMPKYDNVECLRLTSFELAGTRGVLPQLGTLLRQQQEMGILVLSGKHEIWTFPYAFVRQAIETNKGTRFSTFTVGFEAHINNSTSRTLFTITFP